MIKDRIYSGVYKLKKSKFAKSTIIYTLSTFLNSGVSFLLLPVLTRFLTTDEYGTLSMFNATVSFLLPFVSMGAATAVQRKMVDTDGETKEYIFNCLLVVCVTLALVTGAIYGFRVPFAGVTEIPAAFFDEMLLLLISTTVVDIALVVLQMRGRAGVYASIRTLDTILNIGISMILLMSVKMGLQGRIYGLLFSKLTAAIIGLCITKKEVGISAHLNARHIKDQVFKFGLPMIPASVKTTVLLYVDRLMITNMLSISETGIYSVGNQFSLPILFLAQAFNLAYIPWLYERLKRNDPKEKGRVVKLTYCYFALMLALALGWSVISGPIIRFVSGTDYYEATKYVLWLSLGYAFTAMYMMMVNYVYYFKMLKKYTIVVVLVMLSNIVLDYVFIHKFGTVGAAQATMLANFTSLILTWVLVTRICDMPWFGARCKRERK